LPLFAKITLSSVSHPPLHNVLPCLYLLASCVPKFPLLTAAQDPDCCRPAAAEICCSPFSLFPPLFVRGRSLGYGYLWNGDRFDSIGMGRFCVFFGRCGGLPLFCLPPVGCGFFKLYNHKPTLVNGRRAENRDWLPPRALCDLFCA